MSHEPSRTIGNFQRPMELMRAKALLARGHKVESLEPLVQRNVRPLHRCVHGHGKIIAALRFGTAIGANGFNRIGVAD